MLAPQVRLSTSHGDCFGKTGSVRDLLTLLVAIFVYGSPHEQACFSAILLARFLGHPIKPRADRTDTQMRVIRLAVCDVLTLSARCHGLSASG